MIHETIVGSGASGAPRYSRYLSQFLTQAGDGTGTPQVVADFSGAGADEFFITPAAGTTIYLARMLVLIGDVANLSASGYGGGAAIANGIGVELTQDGGAPQDLCGGLAITQNQHWGALCYDVSYTGFGGAGLNYVGARWTFSKTGTMLRLRASAADQLAVTVNDDFTFLDAQTFLVQGFVE